MPSSASSWRSWRPRTSCSEVRLLLAQNLALLLELRLLLAHRLALLSRSAPCCWARASACCLSCVRLLLGQSLPLLRARPPPAAGPEPPLLSVRPEPPPAAGPEPPPAAWLRPELRLLLAQLRPELRLLLGQTSPCCLSCVTKRVLAALYDTWRLRTGVTSCRRIFFVRLIAGPTTRRCDVKGVSRISYSAWREVMSATISPSEGAWVASDEGGTTYPSLGYR